MKVAKGYFRDRLLAAFTLPESESNIFSFVFPLLKGFE